MSKPDEPDPAWQTHRAEWQLLYELASADDDHTGAALGALAAHYSSRAAWDEYSTARSRMLEHAPPNRIPAPGGPFPRIGAPREGARPETLLGRWLNATDLPELYGKPEVGPRQLEQQLRGQLGGADQARVQLRIGDALCAQLRFRDAGTFYELALAEGKLPRAADRLADVKRVLRGP